MELSRSLLKEIGVEASRVLQESFGGGVSEEKPRPVGSGPLSEINAFGLELSDVL